MHVERELARTLQTPFEDVFELSQDGAHYVNPASVRGVPVAKITETSPYWDPAWESLEAFLAKEKEEEALKEIYRVRLNTDPDNKAFQKSHKLHQDNMSKYHKIREIFGPDSDYHPNQLVTKIHMPPQGLCQKEIMYRLACKISDLRVLYAKGSLSMDPWDFIRWRISLKIQQRTQFPGQRASSFILSAIYRLGDDYHDGTNPYSDPIMREAVILAAKYQNRLGNYKTHHDRAAISPKKAPMAVARVSNLSRKPPSVRSGRRPQSDAAEAADQARRERRARLAAQPSTYQGVNGYRAQMQARTGNREG